MKTIFLFLAPLLIAGASASQRPNILWLCAVAAEVWANIFGTEPEDVGTLAGACACNKQRREEKENSFHDCWEFAC